MVDSLEKDKTSLLKDIGFLVGDIQTKHKELKGIEAEIVLAREQLEKAKSFHGPLLANYDQKLKEAAKDLEAYQRECEATKAKVQEEIRILQGEIPKRLAEINKLESEISKLESVKASRLEDINITNRDLQRAIETLDDLIYKIQKATKKLETKNADVEELLKIQGEIAKGRLESDKFLERERNLTKFSHELTKREKELAIKEAVAQDLYQTNLIKFKDGIPE